MKVKYKHLTLTIIIAFILLFGFIILLDFVLNGSIDLLEEGFTALVLAIPVGFLYNLVINNWGPKRSTKEELENEL